MWLAPKFDLPLGRIIRFGLVGILNTLFGLAVIFLCKAAGLDDIPANVIGYACGLCLSFSLHRNWTFRAAPGNPGRSFLRFGTAFGVAYSINVAALMVLLKIGISSYLAQTASMVVYVAVFYLLCAVFVFRR